MWTAFTFIAGAIFGILAFILFVAAFMRGGSAIIDPNAKRR